MSGPVDVVYYTNHGRIKFGEGDVVLNENGGINVYITLREEFELITGEGVISAVNSVPTEIVFQRRELFMAGSDDHTTSQFKKITNPDGTPVDRFFGNGTVLHTPEEVSAAIRELYGMVWWLGEMVCAGYSARANVSRDAIMSSIELARLNSTKGRGRGGSGE
jgi:hypothetical protein